MVQFGGASGSPLGRWALPSQLGETEQRPVSRLYLRIISSSAFKFRSRRLAGLAFSRSMCHEARHSEPRLRLDRQFFQSGAPNGIAIQQSSLRLMHQQKRAWLGRNHYSMLLNSAKIFDLNYFESHKHRYMAEAPGTMALRMLEAGQ